MRRPVLVLLQVGVAAIALVGATSAWAVNKGSNTASGGSGAHACDSTPSSQCIADDADHWLADSGLSSTWKTAVASAVTAWNGDATVSVRWRTTQDFSLVDVMAVDAPYGLNGLWGWGQCEKAINGVVYGGSDPKRWCKRSDMDLNSSYSHNATGKLSIACHEVGHTLGLRHSNESSGSCMKRDQETITTISTHDHTMLDQLY